MKYDATDIPDYYDEARRLPDETITRWLNRIAHYTEVMPLKTIVDLGCGTGRFTLPLQARFKNLVFGIDPSRKMLEKIEDTKNIALIQACAEHLPITDHTADMVFCSQVFHHLRDEHAALDEITRILIPNGLFCIRNSTVENLDSVLYLKFFPRAYRDDHTLLPARNDILALVPKHGFTLNDMETVCQKFARTHVELLDKIRLRALSDLALLPDNEFKDGLRALETYCTQEKMDTPVYEDMDFFVFRRA